MICSKCRRDVLGGDEHDCSETATQRRDRIRKEQEEAMELSLLAWLDEPDTHNELRLRKAAKAYFGRQ